MTDPRPTPEHGGPEQPSQSPVKRVRQGIAFTAPALARVLAARIFDSVIEHWWGS